MKVGFTVFGMILGIAVYSSIRLANETATASFSTSAAQVLGSSNIAISSSTNEVSEALIPELLKFDSLGSLLPYDERFVSAKSANGEDLGIIQVVGIDMLANYDGLDFSSTERTEKSTNSPENEKSRAIITEMLQEPIAAIATSELGESPTIFLMSDTKELPLRVLASLSPPSGISKRTIFLDISKFQEIFNSYGKVNRLLLRAKSSSDKQPLREAVEQLLEAPHYISDINEQKRHAEKLTEAFRLNLHFLAGISLLVGALLIYNTVSYIILKHRRDFGILRSLGAKPKTLIQITLLACLFMGLTASVLGLTLGFFLSQLSVRAVVATISTLYTPIIAKSPLISTSLLIECLIIGPFIALLGGLLPCLEIRAVTPRENLGYLNYENSYRRMLPLFTVIGLVTLALSYASTSSELIDIDVRLGFWSPLFCVIGSCLLLPQAIVILNAWFRKLLGKRFPVEILLAIDHITMTLRRNVVAISAMMIALGMFIGLSIMISSFRQTVTQWIQHITPADIYISSPYAIRGEQRGFLPVSLAEKAALSPHVDEIDWIASRKLNYKNRPILVAGIRFNVAFRHRRLMLRETLSESDIAQLLSTNDSVLVSEAFANRFGLGTGDLVNLPTNVGSKEWRIAGVFYDYSSDQGIVYIPHERYSTLYGETRIQGLSLYLKDSNTKTLESTINAIRQSYPNDALMIRANLKLRQEVLAVFDKTFQITYALQAIALLISTVTILNTILMLLLERSREFGVLRAIGASRKQIVAMIRTESLLIGGFSLVAGLIVGLFLAIILVFVINRYFFAWSMDFVIPSYLLIGTSLATLFLSYIAGQVPAALFAKNIDLKVLRYE
jgi:putative ABC transport system permease protein